MLSELRRKKFTYFFDLLDFDRNGQLEFNDFSDLAEKVRSSLEYDEGSREHKNIADKSVHLFHQLLSDISPVKSQSISKSEWTSFFEEHLGGVIDEDVLSTYQELMYQHIFDFFDHNHDGFITQDEYQLFFEIFGASKDHLDKCFNKLDSNGDNKVSRYEMLTAIEDFLTSDDHASPGNWTFGNWEISPE
jgi:Ca2+-binding EF-hand superfamily protein